ncbi:hypothetical protein KC332_g11627 [Hortaea werneckii]|uniref:Uncharacterized protein n=2 Tax=Hortaea werneckii TaxID=91943 RepID=A0A3M7IIU2_HORWE|nr:hypothetical protein KC358_g3815 [Hortaea werneckii]KAI6848326.1 hypothetical protein KC350_g3061 [Hortaea werneckii]KAI6935754.1 hypothetical protein KC341_g6693 [Hortaea werneckii]KAI6945969.1 hypothetical protein KC348_g3459 [Hortaea werneckii]KAI6962849.1 hypothetical protein KC321_g11540 [Hortaea werneckii]
MLRNRSSSPRPVHLSRGHSRQQKESHQHSQFTFNPDAQWYYPGQNKLELSMHMPPRQCSNRFEVLASPITPPSTPPEPKPISKEFHVPTRCRRSRNSRGTKEAKRRRDARRSRRKLAAQILDDQLSHEIDLTLNKINNLLPFSPGKEEKSKTPETPESPVRTLMRPARHRQLPSPPQLPVLDFPSFNTNTIPQLRTPSPDHSPSPTIRDVPSLPSWCPALPTFNRNGVWSEGLPIFYDLSSLPEPKSTAKVASKPDSRDNVRGKELQLWRGNLDLKPKVSRFFPRMPQPVKPTVKLPPTACKLHVSEKSLPIASSGPGLEKMSIESRQFALEQIVQTFKDPVGPKSLLDRSCSNLDAGDKPSRKPTPLPESSAANLWRILESSRGHDGHRVDPYVASFTPRPDNHVEIANWHTVIDELKEKQAGQRIQRPTISHQVDHTLDSEPYDQTYFDAWQATLDFARQDDVSAVELDGKEIPYVHPNSLVGTANDLAMSPYMDEHPASKETEVNYTPLPSPPTGLNELLINHEIVPPSPPSKHNPTAIENDNYPTPSSYSHTTTLHISNILPIDCITNEDADDGGAKTLTDSDAHYQSERHLFAADDLPALPSSPLTEQSLIDVAAFLKMGHAPQCWCAECDDAVPEEVLPDNLVGVADKLAVSICNNGQEGEEDWVVYAPERSRRGSGSSLSGTAGDLGRCGGSSEWDDFLPPSPASPVSPREQQGGRLDLGGSWEFDEWELEF